jgi:hypothetical protein
MVEPDHSFDANPKQTGSYWRAARDIYRALDKELKVDQLPEPAAFMFYYIGCEKLAKIMKGVVTKKSYAAVFGNRKTPKPKEIKRYLACLGCQFPTGDVEAIFDPNDPSSARYLRNDFLHEVGPTHAKLLVKGAPHLVPKMRKFIDCIPDVTAHIEKMHIR